jgi:hypothetical protein
MAEKIVEDPFAQPSDLWLVPPPRSSAWFAVIDWYLNWQLSKGLSYPGLHLPTEILRLAEDYEGGLPMKEAAGEDSGVPLLVLSSGRLPTTKCVVLDTGSKQEDWIKHGFEIALNLDAKSVHVFLPNKASKEESQAMWKARFADRSTRFSSDAEAKELVK